MGSENIEGIGKKLLGLWLQENNRIMYEKTRGFWGKESEKTNRWWEGKKLDGKRIWLEWLGEVQVE